MGREIVYCSRCRIRLTGEDLTRDRAFRIDEQVVCADCLVPSEREALAQARTPRSSAARPRDPNAPSTTRRGSAPAGRGRLLLVVGGVAVLLAGVVLAVVLLRPADPPPPSAAAAPPTPAPKPAPDPLRAEWAAALERSDFAAARAALDRLRADDRPALERELTARSRARFDELAAGPADRAREEIQRWGPSFRPLLDELDRRRPAPPPAPPAPPPPAPAPAAPVRSEEAVAYAKRWDAAALLAARGDVDRAREELKTAGASVREDAVRLEHERDLADLASLKSAAEAARRAAAALPRGEAVELEVFQEDGSRAAVRSRIRAAGARRLDLDGDPKRVELEDLAPTSLARILAKSLPSPSPEERRGLALLFALDGGWAEAADLDAGLTRKHAAFAETARERAKPADTPARRNEWAARKLFREAEDGARSVDTRADAVLRYRRLRDEFADTACARKYAAEIEAGTELGREYRLHAGELRGGGIFRSEKLALEVRKTKLESRIWLAREEPGTPGPEHRVEASFAAIPGLRYRAWALVGGCCPTTFAWLLQGDELVYRDRKTGKDIACGPDGSHAAPWEHRLTGLSATHGGKDHAKAAKEPRRWEWIELPVPAYATGGAKTIRLIGMSKGMAVAAVVVSSSRERAPDDDETRALAETSIKEGAPFTGFRFGKGESDLLEQLPEARTMELALDLDLAKLRRPPVYDVDRRPELKGRFDRVAYLLELTPSGGEPQAVFVSMDAFTDDVGRIGIPDAEGSFQRRVASMNVQSNVEGITTGTELAGGGLEFWPNNYGPPNSANVPGADGGAFDFGDQPGSPVQGYGSMQVYNAEAKQTIFAINHWADGARADLGIGNSTGNTRDWTFRANAGSYASKRLRVLVRPAR